MTNPRPAVDFLLRCLSDRQPPSGNHRQPAYDWNEVVDAAAYHNLSPLLFKRLKQGGTWTCVPADAWERLRLAYFASANRNRRLYLQLRPLLAGLRTAGIPVIVLKGAYLAEAVYGDIALRPMGDVDLLVPSADLPGARQSCSKWQTFTNNPKTSSRCAERPSTFRVSSFVAL